PAGNWDKSNINLCGYYIIPAPLPTNGAEQALIQNLQQARLTAFNNFLPVAQAFARQSVQFVIPEGYGGQSGAPLPPDNDFETLGYQYMGFLQQQFQGLGGPIANAMAAIIAQSQGEGWVSAGAWFNTIARFQGDIDTLSNDAPFQIAPPQALDTTIHNDFKPGTPQWYLTTMMENYQAWLTVEANPNPAAQGGMTPAQTQ